MIWRQSALPYPAAIASRLAAPRPCSSPAVASRLNQSRPAWFNPAALVACWARRLHCNLGHGIGHDRASKAQEHRLTLRIEAAGNCIHLPCRIQPRTGRRSNNSPPW